MAGGATETEIKKVDAVSGRRRRSGVQSKSQEYCFFRGFFQHILHSSMSRKKSIPNIEIVSVALPAVT